MRERERIMRPLLDIVPIATPKTAEYIAIMLKLL